jgi:ubiquinone/menaquinone biosynthesis C-methylase UbiE
MTAKVDLYNSAYGNYELDVYTRVRLETYGEDLGQTSWVTTEESTEIPRLLRLTADSHVLEIGCGSGRYALRIAETVGCRITAVDINAQGIRNGNQLAKQSGLDSKAKFQECDVSRALPFADENFDAVFSNDVLCHVPGRGAVFAETRRVLKSNGLFLFSDALVVGGLLSHEEIATRSSIGYYVFSPPGVNERLLHAAGFKVVSADDTTSQAAAIAGRWRMAREHSKGELTASEGIANFEALQRFLACVETLTSERRLLRFVYLARKVGP